MVWYVPISHTTFLEIGESEHRALVTFVSADREEPQRFSKYDNRLLHKDGFQDIMHRCWSGMGQAQLIRVPLAHRISRCIQHISKWKWLNRNKSEEKVKRLQSKLNKVFISSAISLEETNAIKDELHQAYL